MFEERLHHLGLALFESAMVPDRPHNYDLQKAGLHTRLPPGLKHSFDLDCATCTNLSTCFSVNSKYTIRQQLDWDQLSGLKYLSTFCQVLNEKLELTALMAYQEGLALCWPKELWSDSSYQDILDFCGAHVLSVQMVLRGKTNHVREEPVQLSRTYDTWCHNDIRLPSRERCMLSRLAVFLFNAVQPSTSALRILGGSLYSAVFETLIEHGGNIKWAMMGCACWVKTVVLWSRKSPCTTSVYLDSFCLSLLSRTFLCLFYMCWESLGAAQWPEFELM